MKRALPWVLIALSLVFSGTLAAQQKEKGVFVKTIPIVKVFGHNYGYKVIFQKSDMSLGEFYVPTSWFVAGGKGEIIYGDNTSLPYFSIFWIDGKFSHIRLYVPRNMDHPTWGILSDSEGLQQKFQVEELSLQY